MDAGGLDPSALSFREKKTLFATKTTPNSEQASPQIGRLNNQTVYSTPASFGPYFERHYQKWMSNSEDERARLTPAKLFNGEPMRTRGAVRRLFNNQKQSALSVSLEAATQTDTSTSAARYPSSPQSPDLVARLWLPGQVNASAKPPDDISCASSGRGSLPSRPFCALANLLGSYVEQSTRDGVCPDPRLVEALLIAQTGADGESRNGEQAGPLGADECRDSGPQPPGGLAAPDEKHPGVVDTAAESHAAAPSTIESKEAAAAADGAHEARRARLQQEALQLQERLRQRALLQYDSNRLAAAAFERSLKRLHEVAAAATTSGLDGPGSLAAGPQAAAAAAASSATSASALATQRDDLAAQCVRLQRQCAGLLSYISMLSGNCTMATNALVRPPPPSTSVAAAAHAEGGLASPQPPRLGTRTPKQQCPQQQCPQQQQGQLVGRVRVRLEVLPGEVHGGGHSRTPAAGRLLEDDCRGDEGHGRERGAEEEKEEAGGEAAVKHVRVRLQVTDASDGSRAPGLAAALWPPNVPVQTLSRLPQPHGSRLKQQISECAAIPSAAAPAAPEDSPRRRQRPDHHLQCRAAVAAATAEMAAAAAAPSDLPLSEEVVRDAQDRSRALEYDEHEEHDGEPEEADVGSSAMHRCKSAPGLSCRDCFQQTTLDDGHSDSFVAEPSGAAAFACSSDMSYGLNGRRRDGGAGGGGGCTAPCGGRASLDCDRIRVPTPPCSPRTSPCSPAGSSGPAGSLVGSGSWAGGPGTFPGEELPWVAGGEEWLELADSEWEELAAAAANGPWALLSAVGFLREQLQLAHLEIVSLTTQLCNLSHQREGLRARATQHDAALQLLAINEGEALLEAQRLRAQLAAERAARARLSAQCEDLQNRLLARISDRHHFGGMHSAALSSSLSREVFGSPPSKPSTGLAGPQLPPPGAGALPRPPHGPHHGLHPHPGLHPCSRPQPHPLVVVKRHRSVPRNRPASAMSAHSVESVAASCGGVPGRSVPADSVASIGGVLVEACCKFAWLDNRSGSRQAPTQ